MIKKKRYISEQYEKHHLIFKAKELNLHMFKCTQTFRQRITRNCFTLFSLGRNWASLVAQLAKNLPAGDPSSIPGSGISPGEEIGYPLQYSWTSLVAQTVKNPPAVRRPRLDPWVGKIPWRKDRLPIPVFLDFPGGSDSKEPVFLVLVAHLFYT